jgi:hypothetical protein
MAFLLLNLLPPFLEHDPLGLFLLVSLAALILAISIAALWSLFLR